MSRGPIFRHGKEHDTSLETSAKVTGHSAPSQRPLSSAMYHLFCLWMQVAACLVRCIGHTISGRYAAALSAGVLEQDCFTQSLLRTTTTGNNRTTSDAGAQHLAFSPRSPPGVAVGTRSVSVVTPTFNNNHIRETCKPQSLHLRRNLRPMCRSLRAHGAVRPCVGAPPDGLGNWLSWFSLGISSSPALSAAVKAAPVCSGLPAHNLPPARIGRSRSSQQTSQRGHAVPVLPRPWWVAWYS